MCVHFVPSYPNPAKTWVQSKPMQQDTIWHKEPQSEHAMTSYDVTQSKITSY